MDSKYIELDPTYVCMTKTHIVAASKEAFYVWQFKNIKNLAAMEISGKRKASSEKYVQILGRLIFCSIQCGLLINISQRALFRFLL